MNLLPVDRVPESGTASCQNLSVVLYSARRRVSGKRGGEGVIGAIDFILSVVAGVIACYIYKWLGGK